MDVGHSMAIKEREVIAVEAVEGTEALIARAGDLCRRGKWALIVFASQAGRSPAFDASLIDKLKSAGATCLAIDAALLGAVRDAALLDAAASQHIAVICFNLSQ